MKYIFFLMSFLITFYMQARPLIKNKYYKELAVYTILLLIGAAGLMLQMAGVTLPSPAKGIELVVKTFVNANFNFRQ